MYPEAAAGSVEEKVRGYCGLPLSVEEAAPSAESASPDVLRMWALYGLLYDTIFRRDPIAASMYGDHRFDFLLPDCSEEGFHLGEEVARAVLREAQSMSMDGFDATQKQHHEFLIDVASAEVKKAAFEPYEVPTSHLTGPHLLLLQLPSFHRLESEQDAKHYVVRLSSARKMMDEIIAAFRCGMEKRLTLPRSSVLAMVKQCQATESMKAEDHPLHGPHQKLADLGIAIDQLRSAIDNSVQPAFAALRTFLEEEYLPHAREDSGIWQWDQGQERYEAALSVAAGTSESAETVHGIGLREVARVRAEADRIREKVGFEGDLSAFMEHLKTDKRFQPQSRNGIIESYKNLLEVCKERSDAIFNLKPEAACEVKPVEEYREKSTPAAHYFPPSKDGSRPGIFYANTYEPESRPTFMMEALVLHEAIPGHHFQIALATAMKSMPRLRTIPMPFCTAYCEGWGLYSEKLGLEMGFYEDVYQDFGRLMLELVRSARLVVDTGLHAMKWNKDRALQYLRENSTLGQADCEAEIDRYMVLPGQACSYKVGMIKILELRQAAEKKLGEKFSIRGFHDVVLSSGSVSLRTLEENVTTWMNSAEK